MGAEAAKAASAMWGYFNLNHAASIPPYLFFVIFLFSYLSYFSYFPVFLIFLMFLNYWANFSHSEHIVIGFK
jgi:hypothetical protein